MQGVSGLSKWMGASMIAIMTLAGCGGGIVGEGTDTSGTTPVTTEPSTPTTPTTPTTPIGPITTTPTPVTTPTTPVTTVTPPTTSAGTLYYVRTDGGTAQQCTGRSDAPYPGSGTGQACAWGNLAVALPPGGTARIAGGDTVFIRAGHYRTGFGAIGAEGCIDIYSYDCALLPVPSGPSAARPTRILGEGHDANCPAAPQLWGTQRVGTVLSLDGTSNAEVACLEITDHNPCVEFHGGPNPTSLTCKRDAYPYGDWASTGIYAADSSNVKLTDLNVHGMANRGIAAGRLRDWTVTRVRIAGNGWAGWDGDIGGTTSSNSGTLRFSRWMVEWNGCAETYPGNQPTGCWGQQSAGYGDGVGTAKTSGNWIIEDSTFRYNSSDGLDLLYADGTGSITLNRVWAEGNAGNQIKLNGATSVTNTVVLGTCGYFKDKFNMVFGDYCRAAGDALVMGAAKSSDVLTLVNSTIVSEGNVAVLTGGPAGSSLKMRNNVLIGLPYFLSPSEQSADTYFETAGFVVDESYSVKQNLRNAKCTGTGVICTSSAVIVNATPGSINPALTATSPALNSGLAGVDGIPSIDFYGNPRPARGGVDRGALELQ